MPIMKYELISISNNKATEFTIFLGFECKTRLSGRSLTASQSYRCFSLEDKSWPNSWGRRRVVCKRNPWLL